MGVNRSYKDLCLNTIGEWKYTPFRECVLNATIYFDNQKQRCDPSDLGTWIKTPIDALVKRKVISGDSNRCMQMFTAQVSYDERNPRLEIHIIRYRGDTT